MKVLFYLCKNTSEDGKMLPHVIPKWTELGQSSWHYSGGVFADK